MWGDLGKPEFVAGLVTLVGAVVLVLKRLDLVHFGRPPRAELPPEPAGCPDQTCREVIRRALEGKLDRDAETGGAHHISCEARSKLTQYRTSELQDALCATTVATLTNQMKEIIDGRIEKTERRIIAAVRQNGKGGGP